jgi:hypothetical protein
MDTFFPVNFLTVGNKVEEGTAAGLYLRWFVKPYLGIFGIRPLHPDQLPDQKYGFRLFYHIESGTKIPQLTPLPLDTILPREPKVGFSDVWDRPSWKATFHPSGKRTELHLDLAAHYKHDICYLRFNYAVYGGQSLRLRYAVHDSQTGSTVNHEVPLHYPVLMENLAEEASEELTYAIHVDHPDEALVGLALITDGVLELGNFYYASRADLPFYRWSPPGGSDHWVEIPPEKYAIAGPPQPLITAMPEGEMLGALQTFYERYYHLHPRQAGRNHISFLYPPTPHFQLAPPLSRDYFADQYEAFIKGKYEDEDVDFHISPQDAAALAAHDPAIAYLFGLFRMLGWDEETAADRIYKLQGTWPDGKRFCIYSRFDPALELIRPKISGLTATPSTEDRVLYDYATFRNHHPLQTIDLSWKVPHTPLPLIGPDIWFDPAAYLVLRQNTTNRGFTCLSPFYIPREEDSDQQHTHYLDWYDQYRQTDINKILDGSYRYHIAGYDIFGQISDWHDKDCQIEPLPLHMGTVQKPRIILVDPQGEPLEIPLVVTQKQTGYQIKSLNSDQVRFEISFFWPLESRYLWKKHRVTGKPSLDHFKLLYMTDIPLFSPAVFRIQSNTASGIRVKLTQVTFGSTTNHHLYELLKKLGAVQANGQLVPAGVKLFLEGGTLFFGRLFNITKVSVMPAAAAIELILLPADGTKKDTIEQSGYVLPKSIEEQSSKPINGQLHWNQEAGSYASWNILSFAGEMIQPTPLIDLNEVLISENKTPNTPAGAPPDLQPYVGLKAYETPQAEGDYGFVISLPATHPLCAHDRFQLVPLDAAAGRSPGEYLRTALTTEEQTAVPLSATKLFSPERIFAFYANRIGDDTQVAGNVLYRGQPLPLTSQAGNVEKEFMLFPDDGHTIWRVVVPNVATKQLPLAEFLAGKTFNQDHYVTTSLSVGVVAVVSGQDTEVKDSLQGTVAIKKLSIQEYLEPPVIQIPDKPQPVFGIPASPPGYDGNSLISVKKIFSGYDLESQLTTGQSYLLYRLPAGRIRPEGEGFPVTYAKMPNTARIYRRNMLVLKQKLDDLKSQAGNVTNYLDAAQIQQRFQDYAEKVEAQPLNKQSFLRLPVTLPGESQTVFLFAIKAYDPTSGKESTAFTCLSKPVYVEDPTVPETPYIKGLDITRQGNKMGFTLAVGRKLNAVNGFGYASEANLTSQPDLLGSYFPHFIGRFRLYATTRPEIAAKPDESDFVPVVNGATPVGGSGNHFCIKLLPQALTVSEDQNDLTTVKITGSVAFSSSIKLEDMPARLFICLRGGNYMGMWSPLKFIPASYREA